MELYDNREAVQSAYEKQESRKSPRKFNPFTIELPEQTEHDK